MQRFPLQNRWADEQWRPVAADAGDTGEVTLERLQDDAAGTRWRFGGLPIELHRSESEGYYLNLTSDEPKVFVLWRLEPDAKPPAHPVQLTVSYNEAGRFMDGGEQVEAVPMPDAIRAWMAPFVTENYKPEPRRKSRRNELYQRDGEPTDGGRPAK